MFKPKYLLALIPAFLFTLSGCQSWDNTNRHTMMSSTTTTQETSDQYMTDAAITTKVKSKLLAAKNVNSLGISVETTNGVVTLTGHVPTSMQKKKAMKLAHKVSGVRGVNNQLIISR